MCQNKGRHWNRRKVFLRLNGRTETRETRSGDLRGTVWYRSVHPRRTMRDYFSRLAGVLDEDSTFCSKRRGFLPIVTRGLSVFSLCRLSRSPRFWVSNKGRIFYSLPVYPPKFNLTLFFTPLRRNEGCWILYTNGHLHLCYYYYYYLIIVFPWLWSSQKYGIVMKLLFTSIK